MKKFSFILSGISILGLSHCSVAQPPIADPNFERFLALGKNNIKAKDYAGAEQNAQKALSLAKTPDQIGNAEMVLGESFYRRKRVEEARAQWNKAAAVDDPESDVDVRAHLALGASYSVEGNTVKAVEEYKALLNDYDFGADSDGNDAQAAFSLLLADVYFGTKQLGPARETFLQVVKSGRINANLSAYALLKIGTIDVLEKKYPQALAHFTLLMKSKSTQPNFKKLAQKQIQLLKPLILLEKKIQKANDIKMADSLGAHLETTNLLDGF